MNKKLCVCKDYCEVYNTEGVFCNEYSGEGCDLKNLQEMLREEKGGIEELTTTD